MAVAGKRIVFFTTLVLLWQGIVLLGIWPESMIPSPLSVANEIYAGFKDMTLIWDIVASFRHLLIGFAFSLIIGTLLGVMLAKVKALDETLGSMILALQSVPSIVWVPLAIIWFGFGEASIIFVVIIGGTFVMTMNMRIGIKNVPPLYLNAARTMGSKGLDLFLKVVVPAAIPHAVTGVKLSWAFSWRALMAAELLSSGPGLGYTLAYASDFNNMSLVIGIIIIIGTIGAIVDQVIFQRIENNVLKRWGLDERNP
ncbi:ABC transporter permease [Virgibacillus alimentarius]|uniref:NitT/TauT family transport system permease protein n=1 Tax=Virgibacillus alimentarius TaxID=698769 RepID=A0ABS4S9C9_9BACI|nr:MULTISPECIES: ABC transporter permease [Virgibacillus]MBP2258108.1 NitT/TauT family transport system permease protein [Virgibacillus alimentarius]HLR69147.1 ABC transporter permease [Virgibacillus sp.]